MCGYDLYFCLSYYSKFTTNCYLFWVYITFNGTDVFLYSFIFYCDFFISDLSIKDLYITNSTYIGCSRPYSILYESRIDLNNQVCLSDNVNVVVFNLLSHIFCFLVIIYSYSYNRYYICIIHQESFLNNGSNFFI